MSASLRQKSDAASRLCPAARHLCQRFEFRIVPFLNPDGVRLGHYRTDADGKEYGNDKVVMLAEVR